MKINLIIYIIVLAFLSSSCGSSIKTFKGSYEILTTEVFNIVHKNSTKSVSGLVIDKATNEPIVGAIVSIVGTNNYAMTDDNGCFMLNINKTSFQLYIESVGNVPLTTKLLSFSENQKNIPLKIYLGGSIIYCY